jgi:hypothetical protein
MPFAEHYHMIQTIAAYAADDPFAIRVLPGRLWCDHDFFNAHVLDSLLEVVTVDTIAIADEKTRSFFVREGIDHLLGSPFSMRICGNVEDDDLSPVVPEYDEDVQDAERDRGNGEEGPGRLPRLVAVVRQGNLRLE